MANTYGDRLALIRYHAWWPSPPLDPYYQYNTSQNTARINYYDPFGTPDFTLDGDIAGGANRSAWNGMIANELNVDASLEIDIVGDYDPFTRQCEITVCMLATSQIDYSNLKLRIALVESNIEWQAPNGSYWHHQVFRHMYPNTNGVSFSISEGGTFSYDHTFTVNSQLEVDNCEIIAFVQSDNGHRIMQGAKADLTTLTLPDELAPFSLVSPLDGRVINTCYPTLKWRSSDLPCSETDINYIAYIATEPTFADPIISEPVPDTIWTSEICLIPDIQYYWKVKASNGVVPDIFSDEVFTFTIILPQDIPTLSEWGMIIMGLLMLVTGTVAILLRRSRFSAKAANGG